MKKSTTDKNVVLLVLGICCLIVGVIWFLKEYKYTISSINTSAFLLIIAGIILIYKILIKTQFKSQKFELKDYWKKVDEESQQDDNTNNQ